LKILLCPSLKIPYLRKIEWLNRWIDVGKQILKEVYDQKYMGREKVVHEEEDNSQKEGAAAMAIARDVVSIETVSRHFRYFCLHTKKRQDKDKLSRITKIFLEYLG
jgi:hypothetical protein